MASGEGAIEQMLVLRDRTRKNREMILAVVIDGHNANDRLR